MGEKKKVVPHLGIRARKSGAYMASALYGKTTTYSIAFCSGAIKELGYKRILFKSDNEPSILKLKDSICDSLPSVEMVPKESPEGDHAANGAAENCVKEIKGQSRSIKTSTEDRYGRKLDSRDCLLAWLSRYAANMITRYRMYSDGRTAVQRLTGRKWGRPQLLFGEQIMVRKAQGKEERKASLESRFVRAIYVGHHGRSGALICLTTSGAVKARSIRRLPQSERFMPEFLKEVRGLPWDLKGRLGPEAKELQDKEENEGLPIIHVSTSMATAAKKSRRMYITQADVERYGGTEGCKACFAIHMKGNADGETHTTECRNRIMEMMKGDEVGQAKLDETKRRRTGEPDEPGEEQETSKEEDKEEIGEDREMLAERGASVPETSVEKDEQPCIGIDKDFDVATKRC